MFNGLLITNLKIKDYLSLLILQVNVKKLLLEQLIEIQKFSRMKIIYFRMRKSGKLIVRRKKKRMMKKKKNNA